MSESHTSNKSPPSWLYVQMLQRNVPMLSGKTRFQPCNTSDVCIGLDKHITKVIVQVIKGGGEGYGAKSRM